MKIFVFLLLSFLVISSEALQITFKPKKEKENCIALSKSLEKLQNSALEILKNSSNVMHNAIDYVVQVEKDLPYHNGVSMPLHVLSAFGTGISWVYGNNTVLYAEFLNIVLETKKDLNPEDYQAFDHFKKNVEFYLRTDFQLKMQEIIYSTYNNLREITFQAFDEAMWTLRNTVKSWYVADHLNILSQKMVYSKCEHQ